MIAASETIAGMLVWAAIAALDGNAVEYQPGQDPCVEAAAFDAAADSAEAERARRRCRLQTFNRKLAFERQAKEAEQAKARELWLKDYVAAHRPVRDVRSFGVDGFLGVGLAAYGLAAVWIPATALEVEPWIGWSEGSFVDFAIGSDAALVSGDVQDSRFVVGARAKWLIRPSNLTPFVSGGVGAAWADIQARAYRGGGPDWRTGSGRAHLLTASAGMQYTTSGGIRLAAEYFVGWPFYSQAWTNEDHSPHDEELRLMWRAKLDDDRHGLRAQVGFGF